MRDCERASILAFISFLPFVPALIVILFLRPIITATPWSHILFGIILGLTAILTFTMLKAVPQVGHYFNALAEFDRNYRYEKEAQ